MTDYLLSLQVHLYDHKTLKDKHGNIYEDPVWEIHDGLEPVFYPADYSDVDPTWRPGFVSSITTSGRMTSRMKVKPQLDLNVHKPKPDRALRLWLQRNSRHSEKWSEA